MANRAIAEEGYNRTDIALTIVFTLGIVAYGISLWLEFVSGAPHYIMWTAVASMISISATFMATLRKREITIIIKDEKS